MHTVLILIKLKIRTPKKGAAFGLTAWRIVPMALEAAVRRLKMMQSWAAHVTDHSQELAAIFSPMRADMLGSSSIDSRLGGPLYPDGTIREFHPWLRQFMHDLALLRFLEGGLEF